MECGNVQIQIQIQIQVQRQSQNKRPGILIVFSPHIDAFPQQGYFYISQMTNTNTSTNTKTKTILLTLMFLFQLLVDLIPQEKRRKTKGELDLCGSNSCTITQNATENVLEIIMEMKGEG